MPIHSQLEHNPKISNYDYECWMANFLMSGFPCQKKNRKAMIEDDYYKLINISTKTLFPGARPWSPSSSSG